MDFLLKDVRWHDGKEVIEGDVRIRNGIIAELGSKLPLRKKEQVENFSGSFVYPGLINAHDHLEMNLYPQLGTPPYEDYMEWARAIYKPTQSPLREIEKLRIQTRLRWGGIKNIIAGVTTVAHHNPWHSCLKKKFPVSVLRIAWAHSLAFEKDVARKFPRDSDTPFVIHAAEGISEGAFSEVPQLHRLGLLKKNTVLVHALALNPASIEMIADAGASVIWCPASNLFMFRRIAFVKQLKDRVPIALGSDSTLTGSTDLLAEIHLAASMNVFSPEEIFRMVTTTPARIFNLPSPGIRIGNIADLFTAPAQYPDYFDNAIRTDPCDISLVMSRGVPMLKNADAEHQWNRLKHTVRVDGIWKYSAIDVGSLKREIIGKVPREILERNLLWQMVQA